MHEEAEALFERFSDLRGQDRAVTQLGDELRRDRVHHAHLFMGPQGVGKATAALAWASRLLCLRPDEMDACGHCPSCVKLQQGGHPDMMRVRPDGATIKIEQIRQIAAETRYQPNEGRWRVIVIERAETMGEAAANALLKTLEEPGGNSLFVLLSAQANRLLPTIRSRCVGVSFGLLSIEDTVAILQEKGVNAERAGILARVARGAPGRAFELEGSEMLEERSEVLRIWNNVAKGELFEAMEFAAQVGQSRDRQAFAERLVIWNGLLRDIAVLSSTKRFELVHNLDERRGIENLASALSLERVQAWSRSLELAERRLYGNVQIRLIMESLVLEFAEAQA